MEEKKILDINLTEEEEINEETLEELTSGKGEEDE